MSPSRIPFATVFAAGVACWFAIGAILIIGGSTGVIPVWPNIVHVVIAFPILVPAAIALAAIRREFNLRSPLGSGLAMFLAGAVSWAMANLMWFYYGTCVEWPVLACGADTRVPFPSPADILYLSSYPWCLAGGIQLSRAFGARPRQFLRHVRVPLVLAVVTAYVGLPPTTIVGVPVGLGQLIAPGSNAVEIGLVTAYMLGNIVLLWLVLALAGAARQAAGGRFRRPLLLLVAGLSALYVADVLFFHSLAVDAYQELGASSFVYAMWLALMPYAVFRFTEASRPRLSELSGSGVDAWHAAADAVVTANARVLGGLAVQVAEHTPGVSMRDGAVLLSMPYPRSLEHLVARFCDRTGPLGARLALEAIDRVLLEHPEPALRSLREDVATGTYRARPSEWRSSLSMAVAIVAVAAAATLLGIATSGSSSLVAALTHGGPVAAAMLGCVIQSRRNRSRLRRRQGEVERSSQALGEMLEALDGARGEERSRVAGEIHDFALQQLVGSVMHVDRARQYSEGMHPKAQVSIGRVEELVNSSIEALRRIMDGLQPSSLLHGDMQAALAEVAVQVEAAYSVDVTVDAVELGDLPVARQLLIFRAVSELVTNAGKHSGASSIIARVMRDGGLLHLVVQDDGSGFDHVLRPGELPQTRGWGLRMLREQVLQELGHMEWTTEPGAGVRVEISIPVASPALMQAS